MDINKKRNELDEIPVTVPNMDELRSCDSVVLIAATAYDKKIKDEMLCSGIPGNKVIVCRDLLEKIVLEYVSNLVHNDLSHQETI